MVHNASGGKYDAVSDGDRVSHENTRATHPPSVVDLRRDLRGLQTAARHQHEKQAVLPRQQLRESTQTHPA